MNKILNKIKQVRWRIWLRDGVVLLVVMLAVTAWQSRNMLDVDSQVITGQQLLVGLDGKTGSLTAVDKPTLIYFFAPWCQVCSLSIGNLGYLDESKVNIVRVALDYASIEEVEEFAKQHNISEQVLLGHNSLKQQFQIQGYPTYYILDEKQKVVAKSYGYSTALGLKLRQVFSG